MQVDSKVIYVTANGNIRFWPRLGEIYNEFKVRDYFDSSREALRHCRQEIKYDISNVLGKIKTGKLDPINILYWKAYLLPNSQEVLEWYEKETSKELKITDFYKDKWKEQSFILPMIVLATRLTRGNRS